MTFYAIFVLAASLTAFDNQPLLAQESIRRSLPRKKISGMQKQPAAALALQWQKWLNEDVRYINSDQEARAFKHLKTDRAAMFTSSTVRWMKSNRVALPIPGMHRHFRLNNGVIAKFALSDIFAVNKQ